MPPILPPYPSPWDPSTAAVPKDTNPTPHQPRYYYFAYGSNLWLDQMHHRCPQFTYIGKGVLPGYKWVISARGYANVIPSGQEAEEDDTLELDTYGVVYTLTTSDMDTLDMYEGTDMKPVPAYVKVTMDIDMYEEDVGGGRVLSCLVYVDPRTALGKVHEEYIGRINRGLEDAKLLEKWVEKVIRKWIPQGVGVKELEEESESEIEEEDIGERKGMEAVSGGASGGRGKKEVKHWVPTGV